MQSLILASAGIVSVGSITIVILLLISDRGWHNGLGYALGYISGYTIIGVAAILLGFNAPKSDSGDSSMVWSIIFLVFGCLLLWLTMRNWRKKPTEGNQEPPRFFSLLDSITPTRAYFIGAIVTVINFKNLAIFLSAVSIVLFSELVLSTKIVIVLLDVLVFCASVLIPVAIYLAFPKTAAERLNWIKQTLENYSRPISIWIPLIFGLIFLLRGISSL